jgi:hypothetical protein
LARWWITNAQQRIPSYLVRALLTTLIPALLTALVLSATGLLGPGTVPELAGSPHPTTVLFLFIVVSPIAETLLMAVMLSATRIASKNMWVRAAISASVWAGLHSAVAPLWGAVVLWPFFVFSCCYLAWLERSRRHALGVTCCAHMLHNALPSLLVALFVG